MTRPPPWHRGAGTATSVRSPRHPGAGGEFAWPPASLRPVAVAGILAVQRLVCLDELGTLGLAARTGLAGAGRYR